MARRCLVIRRLVVLHAWQKQVSSFSATQQEVMKKFAANCQRLPLPLLCTQAQIYLTLPFNNMLKPKYYRNFSQATGSLAYFFHASGATNNRALPARQ